MEGSNDQERRAVEVAALSRWYEDLMRYLESSLRDPAVSQQEFRDAATMTSRVLLRLKTLKDRSGPRAAC